MIFDWLEENKESILLDYTSKKKNIADIASAIPCAADQLRLWFKMQGVHRNRHGVVDPPVVFDAAIIATVQAMVDDGGTIVDMEKKLGLPRAEACYIARVLCRYVAANDFQNRPVKPVVTWKPKRQRVRDDKTPDIRKLLAKGLGIHEIAYQLCTSSELVKRVQAII